MLFITLTCTSKNTESLQCQKLKCQKLLLSQMTSVELRHFGTRAFRVLSMVTWICRSHFEILTEYLEPLRVSWLQAESRNHYYMGLKRCDKLEMKFHTLKHQYTGQSFHTKMWRNKKVYILMLKSKAITCYKSCKFFGHQKLLNGFKRRNPTIPPQEKIPPPHPQIPKILISLLNVKLILYYIHLINLCSMKTAYSYTFSRKWDKLTVRGRVPRRESLLGDTHTQSLSVKQHCCPDWIDICNVWINQSITIKWGHYVS